MKKGGQRQESGYPETVIEDRPDEVTGSAGSFVSSNFESASSPPPSASETSRSVADASVEIFFSGFLAILWPGGRCAWNRT